jgi:hypothetical protein
LVNEQPVDTRIVISSCARESPLFSLAAAENARSALAHGMRFAICGTGKSHFNNGS